MNYTFVDNPLLVHQRSTSYSFSKLKRNSACFKNILKTFLNTFPHMATKFFAERHYFLRVCVFFCHLFLFKKLLAL